jgi:hypothetical protein
MQVSREIQVYVEETIKRFLRTSMLTVTREAHTHPNKPLLDTLISSGPGTNYLADDGTYKAVSGGGGGEYIVGERRNDWVAPYSYCGTAAEGTLESSPEWQIDRIEVTNTGDIIVMSANNVAWTNRYTVTYTTSYLPLQKKNDWNAPYSYCGVAPIGAFTSELIWQIDRLQVNNNGSVVTLSANNVAWDNRTTIIYS